MSEWISLYKGGCGEIEEKKSRFIASIAPVTSAQEATEFIDGIKKKYWDARHNCSAFVIGDNGENVRSSDDGEPAGCAGRPMLEVLTKEKITNVCVVVTRYFGGTLLGTGGLVRAYQQAVKEGLKACTLLKRTEGTVVPVVCDYSDFDKIRFNCMENNYYILDTQYTDRVSLKILTDRHKADKLREYIMSVSSGTALVLKSEEVIYAMLDDAPLIL